MGVCRVGGNPVAENGKTRGYITSAVEEWLA